MSILLKITTDNSIGRWVSHEENLKLPEYTPLGYKYGPMRPNIIKKSYAIPLNNKNTQSNNILAPIHPPYIACHGIQVAWNNVRIVP